MARNRGAGSGLTWADLNSDDSRSSADGTPLRYVPVDLDEDHDPHLVLEVREESSSSNLQSNFVRMLNLPDESRSMSAPVVVHPTAYLGAHPLRESVFLRTPSPHGPLGDSGTLGAPTHGTLRSEDGANLQTAPPMLPFPVDEDAVPVFSADFRLQQRTPPNRRRSAYKPRSQRTIRLVGASPTNQPADDPTPNKITPARASRRRPREVMSPEDRKASKVAFIERHAAMENQRRALDGTDEEWERRCRKRQIQVALGKSTAGYANYVQEVKMIERPDDHPPTPDFRSRELSRKDFEAKTLVWRSFLHRYDPDEEDVGYHTRHPRCVTVDMGVQTEDL